MNHNRVRMDIDLDALLANVDALYAHMQPQAKMLPVLKADAYGHGAKEIARFLEPEERVFGFAVATVDEAYELRRCGIQKPLLVLGCTFREDYAAMIHLGIRPTISRLEAAREFAKMAQEQGKRAPIHIKLDTGMSRIGFQVNEEELTQIEELASYPSLVLEGIFTHLACADEADKSFTKEQAELFLQGLRWLKKKGIQIPLKHCANSAAIMDMPELDMDLVRAGICLYGLWPSEEVDQDFPLQAVMQLTSHITHIKHLEAGRRVSYGGTFTLAKPSVIATIPVGYADGYARSLSNKGYVLVKGERAPIVGRICMDQCMIDVTGIEGVAVGDLVTLVGKDGEESISLEELGEISGRFNYEFACLLGNRRVPKVFHLNSQVIGVREELR